MERRRLFAAPILAGWLVSAFWLDGSCAAPYGIFRFSRQEVPPLDRLTRKELKSDHFALEVQHGVEFVSGHRKQMGLYAVIAAVIVAIGLGVYFYRQHARAERQEALSAALQIVNAQVGPQQNEYTLAYPTEAARKEASSKALTDVASKFSGSEEGDLADYMLGTMAANDGNLADADKRLKRVADSGSSGPASLAKLALAQVYAAEGKTADAEKLARDLMEHPTTVVSKEQATFTLAHILEPTKPGEARKLLEPFRSSDRPNLSRAAINALGIMNNQK
jgi:predicted negative regulator of RcsB-dependent stress response